MESVAEHIFACFMTFLLILTCLFSVNTYVNSSIMISSRHNTDESVFEYLASTLFSYELSNPTITSMLDYLCSISFPNSFITYNFLKRMLSLDDYGFEFSLHYPLIVTLSFRKYTLWCSIKSYINLVPVDGKVILFAFNNGRLTDWIMLSISKAGCEYQFSYQPDAIIAVAYSDGLWGFNWTGRLNKILVLPYDGCLYLVGNSYSPNSFILLDCLIGKQKTAELSLNEHLEFYSEPIREEVVIGTGRRKTILYMSGKGKVEITIGLAYENYSVNNVIFSDEILVDSREAKSYILSFDLYKPIVLGKDYRVFIKIAGLKGRVKVYFGSKFYPSRISLPLISNATNRGLYFKFPHENFHAYLITCNGEISSLNFVKCAPRTFKVDYASIPSLLLLFSNVDGKYYVMSTPDVIESYGGIASNSGSTYLKIIEILGYPIVFKASVWRYAIKSKSEKAAYLMNVKPTQILISTLEDNPSVHAFLNDKNSSLITEILTEHNSLPFRCEVRVEVKFLYLRWYE